MKDYKADWQIAYEQEIYTKYICKVTNKPCTNCSKYGCEHRRLKKD